MQFQFIKPRGILSQHIRYYWTMESSALETAISERVIPTGNVQLMFHYRKPFVMKGASLAETRQPQSLISGLSNTYFDATTHGETGVIAVVFHATSACHFFKFPLTEIENQCLNLRDIFNNEIRQVEEIICNEVSMNRRIDVIESFLLHRFAPIQSNDISLIQTAVDVIKKQKGQISAVGLSDKLAITTKSLERKFATLLGQTPKQFIKLIRFQEVILDLSQTHNLDLTDYAYRNGYFDQSHFIKDFKSYTGYTPTEFLAHPCENAAADFGL